MKGAGGRVLLAAAAVAVVGAIVAGIVVLGPPSEERARRLDRGRVDDLRQIVSAVENYRQQSKRLPTSLDEATKELVIAIRDPSSGEPYGYRVLDNMRYEVCATFERDADDNRSRGDDFGAHRAGRRCFTRAVRDSAP